MSLSDQAPPYHTIVFDCDSTLSAIEGIDELCGPAEKRAVAALTEQAMRGELGLGEVFGKRLELVRPTRARLEAVTAAYIEHALPNVKECIALLHKANKRLVVVSGGLLPAVRGFSDWLGIQEVHAVPIDFDANGAYAGFESEHPLANRGGKLGVIGGLRTPGEQLAMALVGDGATDLEAAGVLERFIAFGGVVRRENVFEAASVHCTETDFAKLLPLLLSPAELEQARGWPEFDTLLIPLS